MPTDRAHGSRLRDVRHGPVSAEGGMSKQLELGPESAIAETWVSPDAKWCAQEVGGKEWVLSRANDRGVFKNHSRHPSLEDAKRTLRGCR